MELKRHSSDAAARSEVGSPQGNSDEPPAKRHLPSSSGPITLDDIELFQKEAIFRQMNVYRRERDVLQAELGALKSTEHEAELRKELESLSKRYAEAKRRAERLESPIVARCTEELNSEKNGDATKKEGSPSAPKEEASSEPAAESKESSKLLSEAQEALEDARAEAKRVGEQLAAETARISTLEALQRDLEAQIQILPVSVTAQQTRLTELASDNARLVEEAQKLQASIGQFAVQQTEHEQHVRDKYDGERTQLEKRLQLAESDLARIRGARDELVGELNIAKAAAAEQDRELQSLRHLRESPQPETAISNTPPAENGNMTETGSPEELLERASKLERQNKALAGELSGLEQAFAKANTRARDAVKARASAEQKLGVLSVAKTRADEKYFGAMRAKDAQTLELTKIKQALVKSSELTTELRAHEKQLSSQISKLQRQVNEAVEATKSAERRAVEAGRQRLETMSRLATSEKALEVAKQQLTQRDATVRAAEAAKRSAEVAMDKAKRQLETQRAISGSGNPSEIQEQLESLRSIALCGVCQKNWKDTALTTCGHVLCGDCIKSRLAARMRKCPMCNQQFQQSDVLEVHL